MQTFKKISPMTLTLMTFLALGGCKEFYDEEFEDAALTQQNEVGNRSYEADLVSTDAILTNLNGRVDIDIQSGVVNTSITLDGIPQNMTQVFYTYSSADCSSLGITIPANLDSTRTYTNSESLTTDALANELFAAGASQSSNDTNLTGTSLLIRAAPIADGLPSPSGTNVITIACGNLILTEEQDDDSTNGTTTGETVGGAVGGSIDGSVGGAVGGDGGDFGGGVGGEISGSVGGETAGFEF